MHHLSKPYNINPGLLALSPPISARLTIPGIRITSKLIQSTRNAFKRINNVFYAHPVIAGSLFSGIKTELADLFAQNKIEGTSMSDIDWSRNFLFFLFGTVHCGLITYFTLVKAYPLLFPSTRRYSVIARVLFDQFITTPLLYFPSFYTCKCLVFEKKSFGYLKWKEYQKKYWCDTFKSDVMASAKIWGPAHFITFTLIPNHLKLLWIGGVSALWTVILSILRGSKDEDIDTMDTMNTMKKSEIISSFDVDEKRAEYDIDTGDGYYGYDEIMDLFDTKSADNSHQHQHAIKLEI